MVSRFDSPGRWLVHLVVIALLLSSCGSAARPAPAATIAAGPLPADWQRVDLPQLSLALPPEWAVTDAADVDLSSAVTEMAGQNPQLKTALEQGRAALTSGQVQLIAYDLDPARIGESGFPTNVRLGRHVFPDAPAPETVADVNEQDLRQTPGFSEVQRASVAIGDLTATRLTSKLQINDVAGQPLALALEQYLLINGNDLYVLTFTTPTDRQQSYRAVFDQILGTVRVES
ncbi:MAG TPA: hypothetical protein VFZ66_00170 [Herpetosiphonaceae bacterium]